MKRRPFFSLARALSRSPLRYEAWLAENVTPTADELADVALAAARLWQLDEMNRLVPGVDYEIDLQAETHVWGTDDKAPRPLFKRVRAAVLERELWRQFAPLLARFRARVGAREQRGGAERAQELAFLDAVYRGPCLRYCHAWLRARGAAPASRAAFEKLVDEVRARARRTFPSSAERSRSLSL